MHQFFGIDPGVHKAAVCRIDPMGGIAFEYEAPEAMHGRGMIGILEVPRVLPPKQSKGDPDDIVQLAFASGKIAAGNALRVVRPSDWKGTLDKATHNARVRAAVRALYGINAQAIEAELARDGKTAHNLTDAIGLALFGLRWTDKRGELVRPAHEFPGNAYRYYQSAKPPSAGRE